MHSKHQKTSLAAAIALACSGLAAAPGAFAQEDTSEEPIEEIVTLGRLKTGAAALTDERMEVPFSADFLSFEAISRAGDSDIAAALRRVPGLTVVDGKFVYVRGLGERYSSVQVNGAAVPSPDLTRSVIPLDLFPTSIVESIKIQKSPSPDQPASFGGGSINIRTKSIPDDVVASFEVSGGLNTEGDSSGLQFATASNSLPTPILNAISRYRGDISIGNIFTTEAAQNGAFIFQSAQGIHQSLIDSLDTRFPDADYDSTDPDSGYKLSLGNSWYFGAGEEWRFGALVDYSYNEKYRNDNQRREAIGDPETQFVDIDRTIYEERTVSSLNVGLDWGTDHTASASYYLLENDEAQADFLRGFDQNNLEIDNDQKQAFGSRFEQRELELFQVSGQHTFYDTPIANTLLKAVQLEDLEFDWFWSDSTAKTDLPTTEFVGSALLSDNGNTIASQVLATTSAGIYSFLELDDEQTSWGGNVRLPIEIGGAAVELASGWWGSKKSREYFGYNVNLNAVGVQSSDLSGGLGRVLAGNNLTVANGFDISLGTNFGTESYIAAQKVDAFYGMADIELNRWRFSIGARYEDYQQATLAVDLLDFSGNTIQNQIDELNNNPNQRLAIREDDTYLSLAATYMGSGLFGADDYQFRLSYGETVVRPDLREIADVIYIDPELRIRVGGNSQLQTSPIDNFEARGEFYYANGDNLTVSLFFKDIQNPIERIRTAGSDDNIQLTFVNAESGETYGVEFEGLKTLGNSGFFLSGNVTLSDSELTIDNTITGGPTNATRRLTGHSEYVANATLGWDSESGIHSAFLNYNVFGERVFYGGISGNDDAFEQPFQSLGVVYKWFPTDYIEVDVSWDNILDDNREFLQTNLNGQEATLIDQVVGMTFGISAKISF